MAADCKDPSRMVPQRVVSCARTRNSLPEEMMDYQHLSSTNSAAVDCGSSGMQHDSLYCSEDLPEFLNSGRDSAKTCHQPAFMGGGKGKGDSQQVPTGQLTSQIRKVKPQLSNAQCKALAAGAPKTVKAVVQGKSLAELAQQVDRDVRRLGIQPQLGQQAEGSPWEEGWTKVQRKQKKDHGSGVVKDTPMPHVFELQPDQFACNGKALPTRQTLTGALPAVSVVDSEEEILRLVKMLPADTCTPLVAVTPMRYKLDEKWEKKLSQPPSVCSFVFAEPSHNGRSHKTINL
eukprot:6462010-Amphidinium_carterae.2